MLPTEAGQASPPPNPTLPQLFFVFASVSLSGFGGVLAWARRALVERRKWMTAEEFNDLFALAQFLPGPNIVNFSVVYGSRLHGPLGSIVAFTGLLGPPLVIVTILGILYAHFSDVDALRRALVGITAAAAGLLVATAAKMAWPLVSKGVGFPVVLAGLSLAAIGVLRLPMAQALPVLLAIGILGAWWRQR